MKPAKTCVLILRTILLLAAGGVHPVAASSIFGALSNFDVFNDTGGPAHGFEIELDGLSSKDVVYTFGGTYNRYGSPKLVDFAGGVYVRYESAYDPATKSFLQATPSAPSPITPTAGHQCWTGGSPNYPAAGCEHFGVSLTRNPTNTLYRWLVADPANPGQLKRFGTNVSLPAPVWSTAPPPAPAAPIPVRAVIQPPPPPPNFEFGEALWVKIFVTEQKSKVDLDHLVSGDPAVPDEPAEVETEWTILQSRPNAPGNGEIESEAPASEAAESVIRRYEFYKYTGLYDPESHEALCADGSCETPGPGELGDYIGSQMAAVNLAPANQVQGVAVTTSGFLYSRMTKTYTGTVIIRNGAEPAPGPLSLQFSGLPNGVTLVNKTGMFQGYPYLTVPGFDSAAKTLAANQAVSFGVQFSATSPINFATVLFSGSLQ